MSKEKINIKSILELDASKPSEYEMIKEYLFNIKVLWNKYKAIDVIPQHALENVIHTMCRKYDIWVYKIVEDPWANKDYDIWRAEVQFKDKLHKIYGKSIYEVLMKIVAFIYYLSSNNKLKERNA